MFLVRGEPPGAPVQHVPQVEHLADFRDPLPDLGLGHSGIAKRESQIIEGAHRLVDDGELEDLRHLPRPRRITRDFAIADQHATLAWLEKTGQDGEERGLATARGAKHGHRNAIFEDMAEFAERPALAIAVCDGVEFDASH